MGSSAKDQRERRSKAAYPRMAAQKWLSSRNHLAFQGTSQSRFLAARHSTPQMSNLFIPVDDVTIEEPTELATAREQRGPLRWFDQTMRCASKGCSGPTWCKFLGVPYCYGHVMWIMNEILFALNVDHYDVASLTKNFPPELNQNRRVTA
jgi:hypothetical protein